MKFKILIGLLFIAVMGMALKLPGNAYTGELVVIANKDVPVSSIYSDDLKNIFLAKKSQWGNGEKIEFVTLKSGPAHEGFMKTYLQKTPSQFQRYFRTLVFTGKGKAPRSFSTEAEVVSFVSNTGGAIGYIASGTKTGSAKVLTVN